MNFLKSILIVIAAQLVTSDGIGQKLNYDLGNQIFVEMQIPSGWELYHTTATAVTYNAPLSEVKVAIELAAVDKQKSSEILNRLFKKEGYKCARNEEHTETVNHVEIAKRDCMTTGWFDTRHTWYVFKAGPAQKALVIRVLYVKDTPGVVKKVDTFLRSINFSKK